MVERSPGQTRPVRGERARAARFDVGPVPSHDADAVPVEAVGQEPSARPLVPFAALWDSFQHLKRGPGGARRVLGRVDPAVLVLRRSVLEDSIKGLLARSAGLRALSMEHKKVMARRLSNAAWKGYILGLAYQEVAWPAAPTGRMADPRYASGVFRRLMESRKDPDTSLAGLDESVVRALAEIQGAETVRLEDQLAEAGAGAIVGPKGEPELLRAAVSGLALMGFMMWVAQREALGQPSGLG